MSEETWLNDYVFTVDHFLSESECDKYIRISEEIGYEEALVTSPSGHVRRTDIRNNQRVMFQNREIADQLWQRASEFVPAEYEGRSADGVNELLRFYRYDPGERFEWHQDFPYIADDGRQSYLTFMIYLNDGFQGGETSFDDAFSAEPFDEFQVVPRRGMALFFVHETHHKGEPVTAGRKYVLRTDIMYVAEEEDPADNDFADEPFDDDDNW